ncbi:ABC transporter ATP-binding protein ModF [Arenibacter antarcticus]|uniref:ATP-binding cassette domain-containing protein n=1 Tax=Arenibacter antarcticus TaxID=2040469 RepID=A0ABW5VB47_9FLAO|nr:ATP-binding cassette domain-containing protein [Arenibacter sp. H213]MCM4169579.1 ABC transporter [Arenibacter sp. H213]
MIPNSHWAIFTDNNSKKGPLIERLMEGKFPEELAFLTNKEGALFSKITLEEFIDEEEKHDRKIITLDTDQRLSTMSSGEQKKALLQYLLHIKPGFLILDNPFDNLDQESQISLRKSLEEVASHTPIIQLLSRKTDLLPFCDISLFLERSQLKPYNTHQEATKTQGQHLVHFKGQIPVPYRSNEQQEPILIQCKNISVSYGDKKILNNINWTIKLGEFWQLKGRNGSGKSTLLSMITGDNHKGYGQELYLFGKRKGSGESVWDIKKNIGYYTPAMTDNFSGLHTSLNMIISGMNDSIGLYLRATENQIALAKEWLLILNLWHLRDVNFAELTRGQQRLIMTARAMVKHPPLLILDEPTAGLDDESATLFIALVNKIAEESKTAIVFVSHRTEPGLKPTYTYELSATPNGSVGHII